MILSDYHIRSIPKLIQLVGRSCGGKDYVNKMNIFCTQNIKNEISMEYQWKV